MKIKLFALVFSLLHSALVLSSTSTWERVGQNTALVTSINGDTFSLTCQHKLCTAQLKLYKKCAKNKFTIQLMIDGQAHSQLITASEITGAQTCGNGQNSSTNPMVVDFHEPISTHTLRLIKSGKRLAFEYSIDGGLVSFANFSLTNSMKTVSMIDGSSRKIQSNNRPNPRYTDQKKSIPSATNKQSQIVEELSRRSAQTMLDSLKAEAELIHLGEQVRQLKYQFGLNNAYKTSGEFCGFKCTFDCSGHSAGFSWAHTNRVLELAQCKNHSRSFEQGCIAWVLDYC